MAEVDFETPNGTIRLHRPHTAPSSPLRAWSSADELALSELGRSGDPGLVLIVNDAWGALTVPLAQGGHEPVVWNDSALARRAIRTNLATNSLYLPDEHFLVGTAVPLDGPVGRFDTVVVVIPKAVSLLHHQLDHLGAVVDSQTRVIGLAMARNIHRSTVEAFETRLGPTETSRAIKKARLVLTEAGARRNEPGPALRSGAFTTSSGLAVATAPGVFAGDRLDAGTELLLATLGRDWTSSRTAGLRVADLGCGNGVLAASLAHRWPEADFSLFDVSDLAVAAARRTWFDNHPDHRGGPAGFAVADGFGSSPGEPFDLIVTNPPFHQDHALDQGLTDRLLADAARRVTSEGTVAVVAQRHLKLHRRLARWFASVETVSAHPTHAVMFARRPRS